MAPMRRVSPLIPAFLCLAILALTARAQVVNYTWIADGDGTNDNFANTANWQDGQVPLNNANSRWVFPSAGGFGNEELVTVPTGTVNLDSFFFLF
jgi:hypothetical protein